MQVQHILKEKGENAVITVAPGSALSEVAEKLSVHRIGAVLVSTDGKTVAGIVSERDVVRVLGRQGAACLAEKVENVMTANPEACTLNEGVESVMNRMSRGGFRHMPVVEGGELVGVISIRDVIKAQVAMLAMEKEALTGMIMGN
ncbi:MAG: CBS domain-containing protein [Paracoccaceae bacterium]|uniref:Histidine kinase n=1 Tax=Pseudothioclava arenosa TaxID=1795308 RepID=A0A2A4CTR9_9RHOB|nr:CBS domain-containing protein [Pseudothioclava arenosa]PCD77678.1 histidine kinase [Pseudothioclava arenosa]